MSLRTALSASSLPPGAPCWVELAARDESAARAFYGELFGWEFHRKHDPVGADGRYALALCDGVQVAGLYQAAPDRPAGWSVNLAVGNAVNTADWVTHLGGSLALGPLDVPERGTVLHAVDPSGAPVVFWQPPSDWAFGTGLPRMFSGADLNTHDGDAADEFYCKLFGLSSQQIGADDIDYAEWRLGHEPVIYRCVMDVRQGSTVAPHWLVYFQADPTIGTDTLARLALRHGGGVLAEPYDTPFGRTALLSDPDGCPLAVIDHSRTRDLGVGRAEVDDPHDD
ncbi:VOC family protein [Saccharomonospora piscinae]|uniref:VOC family protein n=1 Tax=Saccharomonospora piscinae TaxID=687388 RepID=UPI0011058924|nr:VOC family protein [Saccharomonospora piscinae]TLW90934.1 VOC family protein [Saccharomonospora piscinae]